MDQGRRRLLAALGGATVVGGYAAVQRSGRGGVAGPDGRRRSAGDAAEPATASRLNATGHAGLETPGHYAEAAVAPSGRFGAVGTIGGNGSYLLDLSDPRSPSPVHHLPASRDGVIERDVKFDPRGGLYYRTQEPADGGGQGFDDSGVEVVDFGHGDGTPRSPKVIGRVASPASHNVFPHPNAPVLYVVNNQPDGKGLDVVDVRDPANPRRVGSFWSRGGFHDVVVEPGRDLLHGAATLGYAVLDVSDPRSPREVGWFGYADRPDYTEIGTPGFAMGHYADYDPDRKLAVVGDEVGTGVPGGKHVFDVGWRKGSPSNPVHVGFTHSPNAKPRSEGDDAMWTTHNHDVVSLRNGTYLVSGDYSEGVVLYDMTDPTAIEPIYRYATDTGAKSVDGGDRAPWAWGANYHAGRGFVFATDQVTGAYTFQLASG